MTDRLSDWIGPVEVGPVAHGGHCVARYEGRVIFVRHALPGEHVMVRVTDTTHHSYWRGDAVEVVVPSRDRVSAPCAIAGPGRCGGCDFQHVELAAQRRLKAAVVAEQLHRLASLEWSGEVAEVPTEGARDGLGWRTRMRYHVDDEGRPGLRQARGHQIVPLPAAGCLISAPGSPPVAGRRWPINTELRTVAGHEGSAVLVDAQLVSGTATVSERAAGRDWTVPADGFWQVHPAAADTLVDAVLSGLRPRTGDRALDLYSGVGLFAGALADRGCSVWAAEADRKAMAAARQNLIDVRGAVRLNVGRVDRLLRGVRERPDLVVLDPPRSGAGRAVIRGIAALHPRAVAYVACDPAALARDLSTITQLGYAVTSIRAFDLFPMTHHVECVAILRPA